jgi:hypothetical protein
MTFTPSSFLFHFATYFHLLYWFYSFVLCSSLLSTSCLTGPCPFLHDWVRCIPTLHVVFFPCLSAGLPIPSSYCFVLDYPFINQVLSFLPPTLLMWVFSHVSLSLRVDFFYHWVLLSCCTDYHTPVHPTTCNNPVGWHHTAKIVHHPRSLPYELRIGFLLGSWTLRMGPIGRPETSVRNYCYLLCKNPE